MDLNAKYQAYRKDALDGDILLWRGNTLMNKLIRYFDDHYINDKGEKIKDPCYYNHASVVYWGKASRLLNCDSWSNGITVVPASHRVDFYLDFCVIRPKESLESIAKLDRAINFALDEWTADVPYDHFTLLRIAIIKKTGIDITKLGSRSKYICSEFTQEFCAQFGIQDYKRLNLFTPQDHIRFNAGSFEVLFDDRKL